MELQTKKFFNPHIPKLKRTFFDLFLWKCGRYKSKKRLVKDFVYPERKEAFQKNEPSVLWVNHSTFLIQKEGLGILTDPVWSTLCSPISFIGPKRHHAPGIPLDKLPPIHLVLISHNHYDHLDYRTVQKLKKCFNPMFIVPKGVASWFQKKGINKVRELDWWKTTQECGVSITAVPAQHFSGRGLFDINRTLWCGFVVEGKKKQFYFAGDTGYNPYDFKQIGERWGHMDLALIPIGAYEPRAFMRPVHINPKEAVEIHEEVRSKLSIGMHWKTFKLSDEPFNLPPFDLYEELKKKNIPPSKFLAIEPGVYVNW